MANQSRIKRTKINLVRKMGKKSMNSLVWFIGKQNNGKTFYVADYDDDNNTVMWTGKRGDSISFKTERAVQRFIHKHLHDRIDIILIHAPPN